METASSLNPYAPLFISFRHQSLLAAAAPPAIPNQPHDQNPNPSSYPNYSFPCYDPSLYLQQATMGTHTIYTGGYAPPPQCLPYPPPSYTTFSQQYYSASTVSCHLTYSPPRYEFAAVNPPPISSHCTIRELDVATGEEIVSDEEDRRLEMVPAVPLIVHNRRRISAPRSAQPAKRALKYAARRNRPIIGVSHKTHEINCEEHSEFMGKTTLMLKNLPNRFCKATMIGILGAHCREENEKALAEEGDEAVLSEIDYFYLPIDFNTEINLGYCFVNFTTSVGACRLYKYLHNHEWAAVGSPKKCEVNFARIQGRAECIRNAEGMTFRRTTRIPDSFLPVHFHPPFNGNNQPIEFTHGVRERV